MPFDCVECGREIASDAKWCPGCGTRDAGERAYSAWTRARDERIRIAEEARLDKEDPGWRERKRVESEKSAQAIRVAEALRDKEEKVQLVAIFIGLLGGVGGLGLWIHELVVQSHAFPPDLGNFFMIVLIEWWLFPIVGFCIVWFFSYTLLTAK